MSDTDMWPTQDAVSAALAEFARFRDEHREEISRHQRDSREKALEISFVLGLNDLEHRMRLLLTAPVRADAQVAVPQTRPENAPAHRVPAHAPAHRMGEDTQAWFVGENRVPMRRNRGPR